VTIIFAIPNENISSLEKFYTGSDSTSKLVVCSIAKNAMVYLGNTEMLLGKTSDLWEIAMLYVCLKKTQ